MDVLQLAELVCDVLARLDGAVQTGDGNGLADAVVGGCRRSANEVRKGAGGEGEDEEGDGTHYRRRADSVGAGERTRPRISHDQPGPLASASSRAQLRIASLWTMVKRGLNMRN